jgi:hypothetical protein
MSSERRARADDEVEGPAALSNFLMDTLRPPPPEPVAAAVESAAEESAAEQAPADQPAAKPPAAEKPAAEQSARVDRWEDDGEHTPALGTAVDATDDTRTSEPGLPLGAAPRLPAIDSDFEDEGAPWGEFRAETKADEGRPPLDDLALVSSPIPAASEGEARPDFDEPDPATLFLLQERSARRNQRAAVATVVVFLLLIGGGYLLMRGRATEPEAQAAEAPVAAPAPQLPAAARPAEPAAPESVEAEVPEEEGVLPGTKSNFSAALRAPGSPSAEPIVPGGPSTARYPDLPRDVLMQLENAASTERQR